MASDLVFVGGAYAAARGADLRVAAGGFACAVDGAVQRQDEGGVLGDAQCFGRDVQPLGLYARDLGEQCLRVDNDAVADDAHFAAHQPGGQQRQLVSLVADDERMPRIMAALKPHHDIGPAGQPIDDFTLPFVAPLRADNRHIRHKLALRIAGGLGGGRLLLPQSSSLCVNCPGHTLKQHMRASHALRFGG
jgi:hypothetical protein